MMRLGFKELIYRMPVVYLPAMKLTNLRMWAGPLAWWH